MNRVREFETRRPGEGEIPPESKGPMGGLPHWNEYSEREWLSNERRFDACASRRASSSI